MTVAECRLCATALTETFVDLGMSPLCESFLPADGLESPESFYPLHVRICPNCLLVQLPAYVPGEEIFSEYAYFSSYSDSWVAHAKRYTDSMIDGLRLGPDSLVTEVASNDGYLLQHFVARGIPVLGVEPAGNIAEVARDRGIRTEVRFLGADSGADLADRFGRADLVVANNVYAHVPDLIGFTAGLAALVKPSGLVTCEFPHLLRLIERRQYDTIYHEHYQYLTLRTAQRALATAGLVVADVEELSSHGGSLRVHARPIVGAGLVPWPEEEDGRPERRDGWPEGRDGRPEGADTATLDFGFEPSANVKSVLDAEAEAGLHTLDGHLGFAEAVFNIKRDLLGFLLNARAQGRRVVGYGAPGKGNTLLNHCAIRTDLIEYTVDRSPYKQGRFLPGTRLPIYPPERIAEDRPDYVLVLPWNLRAELSAQLAYIRDWGGRLVFPIPALEVV